MNNLNADYLDRDDGVGATDDKIAENIMEHIVLLYAKMAIFFMKNDPIELDAHGNLSNSPQCVDLKNLIELILQISEHGQLENRNFLPPTGRLLDTLLYNVYYRINPRGPYVHPSSLYVLVTNYIDTEYLSEENVFENSLFLSMPFDLDNQDIQTTPEVVQAINLFHERDILLGQLYNQNLDPLLRNPTQNQLMFRNYFLKKSFSLRRQLKALESEQTQENQNIIAKLMYERNHLYILSFYFSALVFRDIVNNENQNLPVSLKVFRRWVTAFTGESPDDLELGIRESTLGYSNFKILKVFYKLTK